MKGKGKILSALLAASLFIGAAIPALAAGGETETEPKPTVNATIQPDNAGTVSGVYQVGGSVQLTAAANDGYRFASWSGGAAGSTNPVNVTYTAGQDIAVTATFDVKVTVSQPANGKIEVTPALPEDGFVSINKEYTFTLTPDDGYILDGWSGVTGQGTSVTAKFTAPAAVTATVKAKPATVRSVKVAVSDAKAGKVTTDGTTPISSIDLDTNQTQKLVAVANEGYEFVNWTIGTKTAATTPTYTVAYQDVADGDTITANFKAKATTPGEDNKPAEDVAEEVAGAIEDFDSEEIDKMNPEKATEALATALDGVTAANAEAVADELTEKLDYNALANLDALMNQANPIQIGEKTVSLDIKKITTLEEEEPVDEIKFAGLSLLAIKKQAQVTMTPAQKSSKGKFIGLSSAKMAIALELKVDGQLFTDDLPKAVKIEFVVPDDVAKSKGIHIYHYKDNRIVIEHREDFSIDRLEDGKSRVTISMGSFSDVVFSDSEFKAPVSPRPSYSGGGGGGMAGFTSYVITATAGPGGSISNPGENRYNAGTNVTYRITPNAGYVIDKVIVDGKKEVALTNGTYTFTLLNQPYTISATFRPVSGSEPSAPSTAAPNPSTGDSWFSHLFF